MERYENISNQSIYEIFVKNSGEVEISDDEVKVYLKKKRTLPHLLTAMQKFSSQNYPQLKNKKLIFLGSSTT